MTTRLALPGMTVCACLLAACSSEPSGGDIEKAVRASVAQNQQAVAQMAGNHPMTASLAKSLEVQVHEVHKIGCKAQSGDHAYLCDVELDVETGLTGRIKKTVPLRLVKGSSGWTTSGF